MNGEGDEEGDSSSDTEDFGGLQEQRLRADEIQIGQLGRQRIVNRGRGPQFHGNIGTLNYDRTDPNPTANEASTESTRNRKEKQSDVKGARSAKEPVTTRSDLADQSTSQAAKKITGQPVSMQARSIQIGQMGDQQIKQEGDGPFIQGNIKTLNYNSPESTSAAEAGSSAESTAARRRPERTVTPNTTEINPTQTETAVQSTSPRDPSQQVSIFGRLRHRLEAFGVLWELFTPIMGLIGLLVTLWQLIIRLDFWNEK